jgi:hypothetical protein
LVNLSVVAFNPPVPPHTRPLPPGW